MRRNLALSIAALIGGASIVPLSVAAFSAPQSDPDPGPAPAGTPGVAEDRYGVIRYDTTARRWAVLATPPFESSGLTGVSCSPSTGVLTVGFVPLRSIGTFTVDEDDAYAGRFAAGAAPTRQSLAITFRRPTTGAVVSCNAAELRIANSSLQVWVRGNRTGATPPPTTATAPPPPPTSPTRPTPSAPSPTPPVTAWPPLPTTAPPPPPTSDGPGSATADPDGPAAPPTTGPGTSPAARR